MPVTIEVRNGHVITNLRRVVRELNNPTPALKLVGALAQRAIARNFAKQTDPHGKPWARLAPATIAARRNKKKSSIKILIDTGQLKNSLGAADALQISDSEARIGTNVKYAAIHNFGAGARSSIRRPADVLSAFVKPAMIGGRSFGAIPQREFMGVPADEQLKIVDALNRFVRRVVTQAGLK